MTRRMMKFSGLVAYLRGSGGETTARRLVVFAFATISIIAISIIASHGVVVSAFHQQQIRYNFKTRRISSTSTSKLFSSTTAITRIIITEDTPRDIGTFEDWALSCGVQKVDGLQLTTTINDSDATNLVDNNCLDIGMVTAQDLPAGQPILFVPNGMIITGGKARQELGTVQASEMLLERLRTTDHIPQFYVFLKILKEYELGDQSPWYPWLNSLPRYFSNGSSMTHFCCRLLPPLVGDLTNQERIRFRQFYKALDYVDFLSEKMKNNRELAKWAYAVTYTRSFPIGNSCDVQIVPMADMFNHASGQPEVELQTDEYGNCYASTICDVPAGSHVRMSYADPTNPSFLFARFGFVDESSPATFCKIMISDPTQQLIDMGYDHSRMLFGKDGEVSQEVWDVLLYQILGEINPTDQQIFYEAHMNGNYGLKQHFHQQYKTYVSLMHHIDEFLTDLDGLTQKAVGRDERTHPRLPLLMKHNEFVKNTFLTVKARLMEYS